VGLKSATYEHESDLPQSRRRHVQPESGPEKAFGKALQEFRKSRDVSQERLALIAGLDRTYISLVERGLRSPTFRTVVRLAEVLDVRPSEVVRRMEELLPKWRRAARI
jgi:transcriptional regulator with XRE-family HTH domain